MNEYELLNLMYLFFISNAMNFVGFVILIWLGFRFAANIYENQNTDMVGKVMVSLFYVSVAVLMTFNGMTGASVLSAYTEQLAQIGSEAVPRLQAAADNIAGLGGPLSVFFSVLILVMQLTLTFRKKPT
jgi:putative Mn2+ efflux pump MntP